MKRPSGTMVEIVWKNGLLQFLWVILVSGALFALVQFRPHFLPVLGALFAAALLFWILGCVFSPARPDRRCPSCGEEGLVKLRRGEPVGVRCEKCGYQDAGKYVAYLDEG